MSSLRAKSTLSLSDTNSSYSLYEITKRQFSRNKGTNTGVKTVIKTFSGTVVKTLLYKELWENAGKLSGVLGKVSSIVGKLGVHGQLIGIATSIIMALIMPEGRKASVWEQIEDKVKNMVHEKLDDNNIALLRDDWDKIGETLKNSSKSHKAVVIHAN